MILVTADWHLSPNPRDGYRYDWQKELRALVKKHRPKAVFVLGDIADAKDHHPATLVNRTVDDLYRLSALAPVIALRGNHDGTSSGEGSFWAFISRIEWVTWVGAPTLAIDLKNVPTGVLEALGRVLFLPHTHDYAADWAGIDFRRLEGWIDWVFTHVTFTGAKGESGRVLTGVPPTVLPPNLAVISGDIHAPQTFNEDTGPVITYVGAPYLINFGDHYEPRVLLIKDGALHSIPCAGPQKRLIELGSDGIMQSDTTHNPGDIVKIQISIHADEYARWPEIKAEAQAWAEYHKLQVYMIRPIVADARMSRKRAERTAPRADNQILEAYAKRREIDERTLKVGMDLLDEH